MNIFKSLQWRLAIGISVALTIMWLFATAVSGYFLKEEMDEILDEVLIEYANRLIPLAAVDINLLSDLNQNIFSQPSDDDDEEENTQLGYIIADKDNHILMNTSEGAQKLPELTGQFFMNFGEFRIYDAFDDKSQLRVTIFEPNAHRQEAILETVGGLLWPLILFIPLSLFGIWFTILRSMRPVLNLQQQVDNKNSSDLDDIYIKNLPSEIEPVANAINNLLKRLRNSLELERNFAANSAHELRTPLAAALAQTQRLLDETKNQNSHKRAQNIETALLRLIALSEKLLQLARSKSIEIVSTNHVNLVPLLKMVIEDFTRLDENKNRVETHFDAQNISSKVDPNSFAILARNLIENALKHSPENSKILIKFTNDQQLIVTNECEVIGANNLSQLTRAFERGNTEANGTGLGLAIVTSIARGLNSELILTSPLPNSKGGFEAKVTLNN
uniref:histidine kinase n=1 Tax=OCS116 cluster bacterium TaxID=2030921 RepID=A0A2A4YU46_9PROT